MLLYQKSVRVLTGIYLGALLFAGLFPVPCNVAAPKVFFDVRGLWPGDFVLNTIIYIPLTFLLMLSFNKRKPEDRHFSMRQILLVLGTAAAISFLVETLQYFFIIGRVSSLFDFVANICGSILGVVAYSAAYQIKTTVEKSKA